MKARWPVRKRLAAVLAQAEGLATTRVSVTPPTALRVGAEHIWCSTASGPIVTGPSASGRQINDDEFTVTVGVLTRRGRDHDECMERVSEICSAIYDAVADGTNQLLGWGVDGDWEVHEFTVGSAIDGPGTDPTEQFPFASAEIQIDFEVRYWGGNQ